MDLDSVKAIKELLDECCSNDSGTVIAAYVTVGGMLGVSILSAIIQWFVTKKIMSEEHSRTLLQVQSERFSRQHEKWEADIIDNVMGLLRATDLEINSSFDTRLIVGHVLKIQLLLNTQDPNQARVNNLVNQLALIVNGWREKKDGTDLFKVHDQLLEATKLLIYRPSNNA